MGRQRWCWWEDKGRVAIFHWRRRRWLVEKPVVDAFGTFILDTMLALYMARAFDATLFLMRNRRAPISSMYELEAAGVRRVAEASAAAMVLRLLWAMTRTWGYLVALLAVCVRLPYVWLRVAWFAVGRRIVALALWLAQRLDRAGTPTAAARALRLRMWARDADFIPPEKYFKVFAPLEPVVPLPHRLWAAAVARRGRFERRVEMWNVDLRQVLARDPLTVQLPGHLEREAAAAARRAGIAADARLVCLHAREGGYGLTRGLEERLKDVVRNVELDTYLPAIDYLVGEGYTVVRLGDPSMRPLDRAGVVDLSRGQDDHGLLQIWCCLHAEFMITGDSGPFFLPWLLNRPFLGVNLIGSPVVSYPLRAGDRYLLKRVRQRSTGRVLSLGEMFTKDYMKNRFEPDAFDQIPNTADEILAATEEMVGQRRAATPPEPAQLEFRAIVEQYQRDGGGKGWINNRPPFLGDGFIAATFVERYLRPETSAAAAGQPRS